MKTLQSLYEDLIYIILSKCSSSIDVWNLLIALDYEQEKIIDLTAFWSHIRLSSYENKDRLFLFIRQIAAKCVDLRLDNFHWMNVIDLRRLLSMFRLIVRFHSGNVSLSRSLIVNDIKTCFPFLKSLHLIISLDDEIFAEIFNSFHRLETISLVRQNFHEGCLTNQNAQLCLRSFSEYLLQVNYECKVLSLEEHGYEIEHRFVPMNQPEKISSESVDFCLTSNLKHFILAFRSTSNMNLAIKRKNLDDDRLNLQTLVLPCLPSRDSIENLNLKDLILLDLGLINNKNQSDLIQLDEYLNRCSSLRNLSIQLSNWQSTRLVSQQTKKVSSIFENCFDDLTPPITTAENIPSSDDYHLKFLGEDNRQTITFNFPLKLSWLNQLTNLNLTGIHCHSNEFQSIFDSLIRLQTLSLSPCLLIYLNSMQCTCQTNVYEMHSMRRQISSLNLVSHLSHLKDQCPILTEQYHHHCFRFSSIHQNLPNEKHVFQYEQLFRQILRRICRQYDFLHLSIRIPHYDLQIDDLDIQKNNHLETLILDMKMPITFHTKLSWIYSENLFHSLKRLILVSETHFELTPMLIDRFQFLEILEIIAIHSHLSSSTMRYLESHLKPKIYPNLQIFRFWIRSVAAKHLLKHLRKTVRLAFESSRPSFQLDISTFNSARPCILFNHSHEIHRKFHSFPSSRSQQLTISYPNHLNFKPLYNEIEFDM